MLHQRGIIITDQEFWFITEEHVGAYQLLLFSEELGISAHYNLLQRVLLTQQFWFIIKSNEYYRLLHSISLSLILENGYWNLYFYLLQINLWLLYFFLCGATAPLGPRPKPNTFRHTHPVGSSEWVISSSRSPLPTRHTHLTQYTHTLALSGNRNFDLSSPANLDACPKPHGQQERQLLVILEDKLVLTLLFIVEEFIVSNIREYNGTYRISHCITE